MALAANPLVWSIYLTIILFPIGILVAVNVMVAQSLGAADDKAITACFKQGLLLAIITSLPMMAVMWYAPYFLLLSGQNTDVVLYSIPYCKALSWSILPCNIMVVMQQFLVGIEKPHALMLCSIATIPCEICSYYAFVGGNWGFPSLGLAGIGYGITISYTIVSLCLAAYFLISPSLKKFHLFSRWWNYDAKFFTELLRIGFPIGVMNFLELLVLVGMTTMMGRLGVTTLAAHQVMHQSFIVALVVMFGVSQGTTARIGNEVGKNRRDGLKRIMYVNLALCFGMMLIFVVFFIGFPDFLIQLDLSPQSPQFHEISSIASKLLAMASIFLFADGTLLISLSCLRGIKDTKLPMIITTIARYLVGLPCAYILGFHFHFGAIGVSLGVLIGVVIAAAILFIRYQKLSSSVDLVTLVTKSENDRQGALI